MSQPVKKAFTFLPGLPGRDDPHVEALMAVVSRMPRENLEEAIRGLLQCALGWQRTGDTEYLTCYAEDALVTLRLRRDPECEKALNEAARLKPAGPGRTVDVREMLAARGLL